MSITADELQLSIAGILLLRGLHPTGTDINSGSADRRIEPGNFTEHQTWAAAYGEDFKTRSDTIGYILSHPGNRIHFDLEAHRLAWIIHDVVNCVCGIRHWRLPTRASRTLCFS